MLDQCHRKDPRNRLGSCSLPTNCCHATSHYAICALNVSINSTLTNLAVIIFAFAPLSNRTTNAATSSVVNPSIPCNSWPSDGSHCLGVTPRSHPPESSLSHKSFSILRGSPVAGNRRLEPLRPSERQDPPLCPPRSAMPGTREQRVRVVPSSVGRAPPGRPLLGERGQAPGSQSTLWQRPGEPARHRLPCNRSQHQREPLSTGITVISLRSTQKPINTLRRCKPIAVHSFGQGFSLLRLP